MSIDNARILVVGDVAAGKTSLIRFLATRKSVDEPPTATVGCELEVLLHRYDPPDKNKNALLPGVQRDFGHLDRLRRESKDYCIELLEIGASHAHAVSRRMFYHDYSGIILVYDLTSPRSCQRLLFWRQEVQKFSFERQDISGDGTHSYARIPEVVTVGEERRSSTTRRIPTLVVGTKADKSVATLNQEQRGWVDKVLTDSSASEIRLSTKRTTDLAPGTKNFEVLNTFFNRVVETRFFTNAPPLLSVAHVTEYALEKPKFQHSKQDSGHVM